MQPKLFPEVQLSLPFPLPPKPGIKIDPRRPYLDYCRYCHCPHLTCEQAAACRESNSR